MDSSVVVGEGQGHFIALNKERTDSCIIQAS